MFEHFVLMRKSIFISLCLWLSAACGVFAAKVDTVETFSAAMNKKIKAVVITPASYATAQALHVVYLLHGHSGNYADQYGFIIVCPDGGYGSWYLDSPADPQ